jgi:DNA invertase Pin-like site-specific DNA recombinase
MFDAAYRHEFDVVLFWSLDRLSREGVLETLQHSQKLTSFNVAFKSFTEQYLDGTGIFRDAVIGILAAIAKQERVRISERTLAGLERARAKGRVGGRPKINRLQDKHAHQITRSASYARMVSRTRKSPTSWAATRAISPGCARRWDARPHQHRRRRWFCRVSFGASVTPWRPTLGRFLLPARP